MGYFDYEALRQTPLNTHPFEFVVVKNFIAPDRIAHINNDFPRVPGPGSHPPSELQIRGQFGDLLKELNSETFRDAVAAKFNIDLSNLHTMYTVRGFLRDRDGKAHTDSETKVITVLLYLNPAWAADGGRLRILRRGDDLEDYAVEIPPDMGTILIFKRSNNSWHGHKPFAGQRRVVQFNWVTSADVVRREQRRHVYSTRMKRFSELIFRRWE